MKEPAGTRRFASQLPRLLAAALVIGLTATDAAGQQPPGGVPIHGTTNRQPALQTQRQSVSQDLVEIYSQTKRTLDIDAASEIIDTCRQIAAQDTRPQIDREYAMQLLAWALNRRGEMRNDLAGRKTEEGRLDEAEQLDRLALIDFREAVELAPDNWRTHHNLAISLAMRREFEAAIDQLDMAIDLKADHVNAYFNRAELYFELSRFQDAQGDYTRVLEMAPNDAQALNGRAHCRFLLEEYELALKDYQRAAELAPRDAILRTDLADAYQFLERWEEAATEYRAAVKLDPGYLRAYQNAAWLMANCPDDQIRNPELAVASARKALELAPSPTAELLDTLAAAYAAAGETEQSLAAARRALTLATDDQFRQELKNRVMNLERKFRENRPSERAAGSPEGPSVRTANSAAASRSSRRMRP